MASIAEEFRQKQKKAGSETAAQKAAHDFWEYEKLINPKFFKEDRWHLKEIARTLQALVEDRIIRTAGETQWHIATPEETAGLEAAGTAYEVCHKLMLNIPPRHGKSYSLQLFEQFYFGQDNENTVITASYNEILATRFSSSVRDGIDATKVDRRLTIFSDIFPNTKIKYGDAAKNIWALAGRFFSYLGTSFGGTLTGVGCRLGVIDDPVKSSSEAFNDAVLDDQWNWYTDTYLSRIEEGGYQIINMTRWSTKDLCGRLAEEEQGEWYTLEYPACLNADRVIRIERCREERMLRCCRLCGEYPCHLLEGEPVDGDGNIIGQMMCPELLSFKSWNAKRKLTTAPIFMANYQQQPVDVTGALYAQGFKTYDPATFDDTLAEKKCSYTDTADTGMDYLCSICFDEIDGYAYVKDIYFTDEPMEITEKEVARRQKINDVHDAVIESNNGGRGFARNVEAILKKTMKWKGTTVTWFFQNRNKRSRIISHSSNVCEQVIMPEGWEKKYPEFYRHVMAFQRKSRNSEHDDGPDCLTGVVEMMNGEIKMKKKVRTARKGRLGIR